MLFPEQWAKAGPLERFLVRHLGSRIAIGMFDTIVHPGVYGTIGLPTWKTWQAVNRSAGRTALRHQALRPLLTQLVEAGVFRAGRVPPGWRRATGVDRHGTSTWPRRRDHSGRLRRTPPDSDQRRPDPPGPDRRGDRPVCPGGVSRHVGGRHLSGRRALDHGVVPVLRQQGSVVRGRGGRGRGRPHRRCRVVGGHRGGSRALGPHR